MKHKQLDLGGLAYRRRMALWVAMLLSPTGAA